MSDTYMYLEGDPGTVSAGQTAVREVSGPRNTF